MTDRGEHFDQDRLLGDVDQFLARQPLEAIDPLTDPERWLRAYVETWPGGESKSPLHRFLEHWLFEMNRRDLVEHGGHGNDFQEFRELVQRIDRINRRLLGTDDGLPALVVQAEIEEPLQTIRVLLRQAVDIFLAPNGKPRK